MKTLNLTKIGRLVKIEYTGQSDRIVNADSDLDIDTPEDGTAAVAVSIKGVVYSVDNITDIKIGGVAVTDQADFETKLGELFPNTNSGSGGSGGASIVEKTYAELVALIGSSGLTVGQQYLITDYATKHYIVDANGTQYLDTIVTGETEGLIVTAVATNKISHEAKSILYPEDVIHYDWNPDNWLDDLSFADLSDTENPVIVTGFKGVIHFRHDTLLDNYMGYDFRNCKFRRWKTNTNAWDGGTTYAKDEFVNHNNYIFKSFKGGNTNNEPVQGSEFWIDLLDLSETEYWNNNPTSTNSIPSHADFVDVKTFAEGVGTATYARCCRSNHFGSFKDDNTDYELNATILSNNVFFLQDYDYYQIISNEIASENFGNTIGGEFYNNSIGCLFAGNQIVSASQNTIATQFKNNVISSGLTTNQIGDSFQGNFIGNFLYNNVFGNSFLFNNVGKNFSGNIISGVFTGNTVGKFFGGNNILGYEFTSNIVLSNFKNITVYSEIEEQDMSSWTFIYNQIQKELLGGEDEGELWIRYISSGGVNTVIPANT